MTSANFHQSVRDARSMMPVGFIGQAMINDLFRSITVNNQAPQAYDTWTISVPAAPDDSTDYSITHIGQTATYAADSSSTQAEVGQGLADAYNATPGMRAKYAATYAAGVITLTAVWPGYTYTPTVNSADTTQDLGAPSNSVAAAEADTVAFGRVLVSNGFTASGSVKKGFVPKTSNMMAQVITFTFAGNTASYYHGSVDINGKRYMWGGVVWDTNLATTLTAIAAAINAVMPAETVIADGSSGTVCTLTAEVEGAEFDADAHAQGHADAEATKAYTTGPSISTSIKRAFAGLSVRRLDVADLTSGGDDPAYKANANVEAQVKGLMIVQRDTSETWAFGDELYVSVAAATKGRLYNTAGNDRVWLPPSLVRVERSESSTTSDGLGLVLIGG